MNALLLRCCGYLRALATHQALGSRSVISVVRGQGRSRVHDPGGDCSRPGLRRFGSRPPAFSMAPKRSEERVHRPLLPGRMLPASRPVCGASACRRSPGVSDPAALAGRQDSRVPGRVGMRRCRPRGDSGPGFRGGRSRCGLPPIQPGCVAWRTRSQSRCTGG